MSLHALSLFIRTKWMKYSALLTLQSSIDPYLPCSAAIKFHDIRNSNIPYRPSTAHALHRFCIQAKQIISVMLSIATTFSHPQHNSLPSTSTCTTHPALTTKLPFTTLLCTQLQTLSIFGSQTLPSGRGEKGSGRKGLVNNNADPRLHSCCQHWWGKPQMSSRC